MEGRTLPLYNIGALLDEAMSSGKQTIDLTVVFEEDMGLTQESVYRLHDYYPNLFLLKGHKSISGLSKDIENGRYFTIQKEDDSTFTLQVTTEKNFPKSTDSEHKSMENAVEAAVCKMFQK